MQELFVKQEIKCLLWTKESTKYNRIFKIKEFNKLIRKHLNNHKE